MVDMQANPGKAGSSRLNDAVTYGATKQEIPPEDIEPEVRAALCDVFMQPAEQPPYCLAWVRSDSFEVSANTIKRIPCKWHNSSF